MNVKNVLTVNAIFVALIALSNIIAPTFVIEQNGQEATDHVIALTRLVGAMAVGYGVASWLMRNAGPSMARRAFLIGAGVGYFVVAAIFLLNTLTTDLGTALSWGYIIISVLLGIDFIFFAMKEPAAE